MPKRPWMKRLCMNRLCMSRDHARVGWMTCVQLVGKWSFATDAKAMFAVADGGDMAAQDEAACGPKWFSDMPAGVRETVRGWLATEPREARTCDLADLRAFLGRRTRTPCPRCREDADPSELAEHGPCFACDGDGRVEEHGEVRLFWPDMVFDPWLLLTYLPRRLLATERRVTVGISDKPASAKTPPGPCLVVTGAGFSMRLMPLETSGPDIPTPRYLPGVGALWHHRGTPDEGILADWITDAGEDPADVLGLEVAHA